jgi:DNA-binding GntR family transcriptional regulator
MEPGEQILFGRLAPGDTVPSRAALQAPYKVSKETQTWLPI